PPTSFQEVTTGRSIPLYVICTEWVRNGGKRAQSVDRGSNGRPAPGCAPLACVRLGERSGDVQDRQALLRRWGGIAHEIRQFGGPEECLTTEFARNPRTESNRVKAFPPFSSCESRHGPSPLRPVPAVPQRLDVLAQGQTGEAGRRP